MNEFKSPWGKPEINVWREKQSIQRSYHDDVVLKIKALKSKYCVKQYGDLSYGPLSYPLYVLKNSDFNPSKKNILITGGVHGYETSGVHGALRFLETQALKLTNHFNFIVAPCLSPWGYETINRWNPDAVDPNRSFFKNGPTQECNLFMEEINSMNLEFLAHIDLHETTDTDNSVFRPALEARDNIKQEVWDIPDGFYLVGDSENPQSAFQKAIIDSVRKVTHIAPSDNEGKIIGKRITQEGVINYPVKDLKLCAGFSNAQYSSTTEVYPDSPKVSDEDCINAQVAALCGGIEFLNFQ